MTDQVLHLPDGQYPLLPNLHRAARDRVGQHTALPEIQLVLGRDVHSSGLTIAVWEATDGHYPERRTLYAARWLEPVLTTEGALRMAAHGAAAAVAELFGPELSA